MTRWTGQPGGQSPTFCPRVTPGKCRAFSEPGSSRGCLAVGGEMRGIRAHKTQIGAHCAFRPGAAGLVSITETKPFSFWKSNKAAAKSGWTHGPAIFVGPTLCWDHPRGLCPALSPPPPAWVPPTLTGLPVGQGQLPQGQPCPGSASRSRSSVRGWLKIWSCTEARGLRRQPCGHSARPSHHPPAFRG